MDRTLTLCPHCTRPLTGRAPQAIYCSRRCKSAAHRKHSLVIQWHRLGISPPPPDLGPGRRFAVVYEGVGHAGVCLWGEYREEAEAHRVAGQLWAAGRRGVRVRVWED